MNQIKSIRKLCFIPLLFLLLFSLSGCASSAEPLQMNGMYFDTIITIRIWDTSDRSVLEECEKLCQKYENLFSRTIDTSDVSRINQANGQPVTVDQETADLIKTALHYGDLSDGKFDITIAPLSELWNFGHNDGQIPDPAAIEEARSHVNYKNVKVDGTTVQLLDPKAAIDLGAIAKGYIADQLKEYLESAGIKHGLISLGGNTVAIGEKPDGSPFKIGVQKPFAEQNDILTSLDIRNQSVVSSGTYERYFEKDGKIYHHILNPFTGYPYETHLQQVAIISDASVDGDALSTTCFALGLENGSKLIKSLDGIEAIFVTNDGNIHRVG